MKAKKKQHFVLDQDEILKWDIYRTFSFHSMHRYFQQSFVKPFLIVTIYNSMLNIKLKSIISILYTKPYTFIQNAVAIHEYSS